MRSRCSFYISIYPTSANAGKVDLQEARGREICDVVNCIFYDVLQASRERSGYFRVFDLISIN